MTASKDEMPFPAAYLLALILQVPLWLLAGLGWGAFMVVITGWDTAHAIAGGVRWGMTMWILVGNLVAIGIAWRRSAEFPAPDRIAFREALRRVSDKLGMITLAESADMVVLAPKRVPIRFRQQEARVTFSGDTAVVSAPALTFSAIRRELQRAMAQVHAVGP
jgi:hypothetical protein